jgi:uncharacterized protein (TIRG00374 family)
LSSEPATLRLGGSRGLRLAGLIISLLALGILVRSVDLAASARLASQADLRYLLGCLAVIATQVALRSARWRLLLPRRSGGDRIALRRIPAPLLVGYLGNAVLPARLGEPVRAYLVARREGVDAMESFGSVVVERVVDTVTLALVAWVAAMGIGAPEWLVRAMGIVAVGGLVLIAVMVTVGFRPLATLARRLMGWMPGGDRLETIAGWFERLARGVDRPSRSLAVVVAVIISAACWLLDMLTFWLVARSIGVEMTLPAALLVAAVTVLGTALPSAPGYVGTFELAAATTAQALGVGTDASLALAVLAHAICVLPAAIAGALALVSMDVRLGRLVADAASASKSAKSAAGR